MLRVRVRVRGCKSGSPRQGMRWMLTNSGPHAAHDAEEALRGCDRGRCCAAGRADALGLAGRQAGR
eukprot:5151267-Alexandrium_andersonii.AAC.1